MSFLSRGERAAIISPTNLVSRDLVFVNYDFPNIAVGEMNDAIRHGRCRGRVGDDQYLHEILPPPGFSTDDKMYTCNIQFCGAAFITHNSLIEHEINYHNIQNLHPVLGLEKKGFTCDVCGRIFSKSSNLKTHKLRHTGEKPFKCEVCSHGFTTKQNLQFHAARHHRQHKQGGDESIDLT